MTISSSTYLEKKPIAFLSKASRESISISPPVVAEIVLIANEYLRVMGDLFSELKLDIYDDLGRRPTSGFIGEVFGRFFVEKVHGFRTNPHPDGRPDLLDVSSQEALAYLRTRCFVKSADGTPAPRKSLLAPFKYGGLEVKATIGSPVTDYKSRIKKDLGRNEFAVGVSRINYLNSINYFGHHTDCDNLVGLYYDYFADLGGVPQIMAVTHAELIPNQDWNKVSIGKPGSKRTSGTSLTARGVEKMMKNTVLVRKHPTYIARLRLIGLKI